MNYSKVKEKHIDFFSNLVGAKNLILDDRVLDFSKDHTEDLVYRPEIVLFPTSSIQISEIVKYCNQNLIPITPSAALTGLSGGALPYFGGVSLSTKKMNKILEINSNNFQAIVEPGLINEEFQTELAKKKLF